MGVELFLLMLVLFLALTVLILVFRLRKIKRNLVEMSQVLEDIKNGNENRKILCRDNEDTTDIGYKINEIVTSYKLKLVKFETSEKGYKQLLTSLSHDVRTPLTSLIGYLDAIHNGVVEGVEEEEYLEIARSKAYHLKEFVDLLFEWFKLEAGERTFHFEVTDIHELTRQILVDFIPIFEMRGIDIHVAISEDECRIALDKSAYTRMLHNLIQNALEHSKASQIGLEILHKAEAILVNVFDNGKGIDQKDIPYIFDRLYKCDTARSHKGSGLGLSIVKELAAAHNGTVSITSSPNERTVFSITLPIQKSQ